jgi:hypothetical protein
LGADVRGLLRIEIARSANQPRASVGTLVARQHLAQLGALAERPREHWKEPMGVGR